MFCTVLRALKSPVNVGTIVRTHVAFGGAEVVFVGQSMPWQFKKRSQAFSRKLERLCEFRHFPTDDGFFDWVGAQGYSPVAVEISQSAVPLPGFRFPEPVALIFGSEAGGLQEPFLSRCKDTVFIPQFGAVECHNVAISAAMAMYELRCGEPTKQQINGSKFQVAKALDSDHAADW